MRAAGWALTDQHLASAIRSVAAPIRDEAGTVLAAVNVNANAIETSVETLLEDYLPKLLATAADIGGDWRLWNARPLSVAQAD